MKKQARTINCVNSETLCEENVKQNLSAIAKYLRIVQNKKFIKDSVLKLFETCGLPEKCEDSAQLESSGKELEYTETYLMEIEEILRDNDYLKEFDECKRNGPISKDLAYVTRLKCLGLGSISQDKSAKFQLCYILLLQRFYKFDQILCYDPAFNELDRFILERIFHLSAPEDLQRTKDLKETANLSEKDSDKRNGDLYFLPHFPVAEFEILVSKEKPRLIIGNDIVGQLSHKGLLGENLNKYPNLMMMAMANKNDTSYKDAVVENEGFQVVDSFYRKKSNTSGGRRKKKGSSLVIDFEQREKTMKDEFEKTNQWRKYYESVSRRYLFPDDEEVPSFNDLCVLVIE